MLTPVAVKVTLLSNATASVVAHCLVVVFQVPVLDFALKLILLLVTLILMVIGVLSILKPILLSLISR